MKKIYLLLCLLTAAFTTAMAVGETRQNAINITSGSTHELLESAETNITTWFCINSSVLGANDLVTVALDSKNYGDITFYWNDETSSDEMYFISGPDEDKTVKKLWTISDGKLYIAIGQEGEGGKATFSFSKAKPGETRYNAIDLTTGDNKVSTDLTTVWYKYTYTETESKQIVVTSNGCVLGAAQTLEGKNICPANLLDAGFRMVEGETFYLPVSNSDANATVTIALEEIQPGYYSDYPIKATGVSSFILDIPADPSASTDSSAQSERYFQYVADKDGLLMWGTGDSNWVEAAYGCVVRDVTDEKTLNTPLTEFTAGMITYTIPVIAGHTYLIDQSVAHTKQARQVTVYVMYKEPQQGDTKDNPFSLKLSETFDLGRKTATTKYYRFTATAAGIYTATIHAGGQVRATTPQDGSWNIGRDYSIQELQMHIDKEITLAAGESLLLEVTLTSDIDIHVDGSDSTKPNYSILITKNDGPEPEHREGDGVKNAIIAEQGKPYPLYQSSAEDFYEHYYKIDVPANHSLIIVSNHPEAISSPSFINFTLDGNNWNEVKNTITIIRNVAGTKTIGRRYATTPIDEDRTVYVETDGISFLYEGATWTPILVEMPIPGDANGDGEVSVTDIVTVANMILGN